MEIGNLCRGVQSASSNLHSTFEFFDYLIGESKISTVPDQAEARVGITVNESTVKAAQDKANQVISSINEQLGELGVEKKDIKTENYSLYPN